MDIAPISYIVLLFLKPSYSSCPPIFLPIHQDDVIQEAREHDGRVLVTVEESVEGWTAGARNVRDVLEPVGGPDAVQTPRQVYEMLQAEGFRVQYVRVPLTDGTAPKPRDFDSFYSSAGATRCSPPPAFMGSLHANWGGALVPDPASLATHLPCPLQPRRGLPTRSSTPASWAGAARRRAPPSARFCGWVHGPWGQETAGANMCSDKQWGCDGPEKSIPIPGTLITCRPQLPPTHPTPACRCT